MRAKSARLILLDWSIRLIFSVAADVLWKAIRLVSSALVHSILTICLFFVECRHQSYALLLAKRMPGKNWRAKACLCMHRLYPSLSTTWNNMQIGASTSIILFIVFTHFQFDFSYNPGPKQLINTIGLLDFVSHQHHIFIFWKGWWSTNSISKTLLARAPVSCYTRAMYYGCSVSVA